MRLLLFIVMMLGVVSILPAQFTRVEANTGNIGSRTLTKPTGDNEFVSVIEGELYHVTYDTSKNLTVEWIENSIVDVFDFVMHDIDRDGDKDILCYKWVSGGFHVYLKDNGKFHYFPNWNITASSPHFLHSQDFNDDGYEDLMINHNVYENTGVNEHSRILRYPLLNKYYYANADFIDYDDDGDKDILFHQIHRLWVLINKGTETIIKSLNVDETNNVTTWNRVIKTTDGKKIIYYDRGVDKIKELIFTDSASYVINDLVDITSDPNSSEVVVYDLDHDGTEEIIINSYNYRDISVFKYNTENNTGEAVTLQMNTDPVLAFGIFEVENEPFLFIAKQNANETYRFNDELLPVLISSRKSAINGYTNGFKDFEGDGNVDVITNDAIKRYLGGGEFGEIEGISLPSTGGSLIDYDLDGDLDYVKTYEWFENIGDYMFGPSIEIPDTDPTPEPEIFFTKELIRKDIDKDGDIDILTYNNFGEPLELLENDNDVEFKDPVTIATADDISGDVVSIRILDLDGDSINDILFATHSGMVILNGTGGVSFDLAEQVYLGNHKPLTLDVADINFDGFPDVLLGTRNIIAGSALGEVILYVGNDDFPITRTISVSEGYHRAAFANVDSAGMTDIVMLNTSGLSWVSLNSDYSFQKSQIDVGFLPNGVFLIKDVDSDNDDDIILYRDNTNSIYYYLNSDTIVPGNGCPEGNVYLRNQEQVDFFLERYGTCPIIDGDLVIGRSDNGWSDIEDIYALNSIRVIKGDLNLRSNNMLEDLMGLQNLERIEGTFDVTGHKSRSFAGMEKLQFIGGDFKLNNVATVGNSSTDLSEFESLDTILGDVHILRSNVTSINSLLQPTFYGDLKLEYVYPFHNVDSFDILDTIVGELFISGTAVNSLMSLEGLEQLGGLRVQSNEYLVEFGAARYVEHIAGDVYITDNRSMNFNNGLENLKTVGGDFRIHSTHCGGLENLQYVAGKMSLLTHTIGEQSFTALDSVGDGLSILTYTGEDFHQLSNVTKVYGKLNITNNDVTSLYGLHNINNEVASLDIVNNDFLKDLEGLNDSITVAGEWRLFNNYALNYCDVVPLCRHIASDRALQLFNNGIDCEDISTVRCVDNLVSGFVYYDHNKNGLKDANEAVLPNIRIAFGSSQDTFITSDNGYFLVNANPGDSIDIKVIIPGEWVATSDATIQIDSFILGDAGNYGNNIGLVPEYERSELSVSYNQGLFLCSREYDLDVEVLNSGTSTESSFLRVYYPEHVELESEYTDFTVHDEVNHILYFTLDLLYPFFSEAFTIPFIAPDATHFEELFKTTIELLKEENAEIELVETVSYENVLLCSYDPNDKLVRSSNGSTNIHLNSDDELIYTIRFQNTGNYFAENVRVVDTLSAYLDHSSFEFIAASHPVEIMQRDSIFYFNFYDIQLPDSTMDFKGSQGFVTFRIKPLSSDMTGLEINNDADIYFDFNDAILTNVVRSEIVDLTSVVEPPSQVMFSLYPNPASREVVITFNETVLGSDSRYAIYSVTGVLVGSGDLSAWMISLKGLKPGVYFVNVSDEDVHFGFRKLVVVD